MKKLPSFLSLFLLLSTLNAMAKGPAAMSSDEVTRLLDDLFRSSASIGKIELKVKTETQSRHLKMRIWSKGQDKSLIVIDEPPREAGTTTLKVGNNLWNYLPKIAKTIRIPPSMMLSSWMGTDFTNDDLVKESSFQHDFNCKVEPRQPSGWTATFEVKPDIVGRWQKIETWISQENRLPVESKFYDRKGRLARTIQYEDVQNLGGKKIPTRLKLKSEDQPGHETELHYIEMKFNATIPESTFSLSQIEKG